MYELKKDSLESKKELDFFLDRNIEVDIASNAGRLASFIMQESKKRKANSVLHHPSVSKNWAVLYDGRLCNLDYKKDNSNLMLPVSYVLGPIVVALESLGFENVEDMNYHNSLADLQRNMYYGIIPELNMRDFKSIPGNRVVKGLEQKFEFENGIKVLGTINIDRSLANPCISIYSPNEALYDYVERRVPVVERMKQKQ